MGEQKAMGGSVPAVSGDLSVQDLATHIRRELGQGFMFWVNKIESKTYSEGMFVERGMGVIESLYMSEQVGGRWCSHGAP